MKRLLSALLLSTTILSQAAIYQECIDQPTVCTYETCCPPLHKKFNFTPKAGIAPAFFSERGTTFTVSCTATPAGQSPLNPAAQTQKFNDSFKLPWSVGFDLGYSACDNLELFLEFNYRQANNKITPIPVSLGSTQASSTATFDKFQAIGGFLGFRHYSCRFLCDRLSLFWGGKLGVVHYKEINANPLNLTATVTGIGNVNFNQNVLWFRKTTAPGAGLQVGLDAKIHCNFSFFLNAEVLAACSMKSNLNIVSNNPAFSTTGSLGITNVVRGGTGTLVAFPIQAGFRFWFG